jgi:hypothetical protein
MRKGQQHPTRHVSVVLEVVAGLHGKGRQSGRPPSLERGSQIAKHQPRTVGVGQIVAHVGVREIKLTRGGVEIVAPFRDGQRNDLGGGVRHPVDDGGGIVAAEQKVDQRADHPGFNPATRMLHHQRVEAVLFS